MLRRLTERFRNLRCWWYGGHKLGLISWRVREYELSRALLFYGTCYRCHKDIYVGLDIEREGPTTLRRLELLFREAVHELMKQALP